MRCYIGDFDFRWGRRRAGASLFRHHRFQLLLLLMREGRRSGRALKEDGWVEMAELLGQKVDIRQWKDVLLCLRPSSPAPKHLSRDVKRESAALEIIQ